MLFLQELRAQGAWRGGRFVSHFQHSFQSSFDPKENVSSSHPRSKPTIPTYPSSSRTHSLAFHPLFPPLPLPTRSPYCCPALHHIPSLNKPPTVVQLGFLAVVTVTRQSDPRNLTPWGSHFQTGVQRRKHKLGSMKQIASLSRVHTVVQVAPPRETKDIKAWRYLVTSTAMVSPWLAEMVNPWMADARPLDRACARADERKESARRSAGHSQCAVERLWNRCLFSIRSESLNHF
jgi:hypothetical protein